MTPKSQLALPFHERFEIPASRWSWREGDMTHVVYIGAHSIDQEWSWWGPWRPWA